MKNILDYVKTELHSFDTKPFNEVDSLVLSQLAYIRMDGMVPSSFSVSEPVSMWQLLKAERFDSMFDKMFNAVPTRKLLFAAAASPRFRDMKLCCYDENTDSVLEKQFASVTFILPYNTAYIAFRGTDSTVIGWKEDFNMAFMQSIPSQHSAVAQVDRVGSRLNMPLMAGGHSKGGNLAVYGSARCSENIQNRITAVYSHDGPGFRMDMVKGKGFERIADRIRKTVPEYSVVGMLLMNLDNYRVVKSNQKHILQHDPFSWGINKGDFVYTDSIAANAAVIDRSVSQWLASTDDHSRQRFIDTLFEVITAADINSLDDLSVLDFTKIVEIIGLLREVDPETKVFLRDTIKNLAVFSVKNFAGGSKIRNRSVTGKELIIHKQKNK